MRKGIEKSNEILKCGGEILTEWMIRFLESLWRWEKLLNIGSTYEYEFLSPLNYSSDNYVYPRLFSLQFLSLLLNRNY